MNSWTYQGKPFKFEYIGENTSFVYKITNTKNNKSYLGKKTFQFKKTKQVNKKKKRILVESDWKEYYGSSKELLEDLKKIGSKWFKREILYLVKNKALATYLEAKLQFQYGVLESNDWYNSWIMARVRKSNILGKL